MLKILKRLLKPKEAGVSIFQRDNGFFLYGEDKTVDRIWMAKEPCIDLPLDAADARLGATIRELLSNSRTQIETPEDFAQGYGFVLQAAGVRSYKQFMAGCNHCSINRRGKKLVFAPAVNQGAKGFAYTDEGRIEMGVNCSDEKIGAAALACLDESKQT